MTSTPFTSKPAALLFYRIMAFATGIFLFFGTVTLIVKAFGGLSGNDFGWVWAVHGYLYIVYLIATLNLGIKLRWDLYRMLPVLLAGTVPTMSFVAEHFVTRAARPQLARPVSTPPART